MAVASLRFIVPVLSLYASLHAAGPSPVPVQVPRANVDTTGIHKLYMDGEFDPAIAMLEGYLVAPARLSHGDSVFIFKHLGVMYAATYETREKGKMYMHRLLMTEPTAKIMDMYASDMIYMIFKNIQDEFQTNRARYNVAPDSREPDLKPTPKSIGRKAIWIGAAVLAVGVGAFFLVNTLASGSGSGNHSF